MKVVKFLFKWVLWFFPSFIYSKGDEKIKDFVLIATSGMFILSVIAGFDFNKPELTIASGAIYLIFGLFIIFCRRKIPKQPFP